MRRVAPAVIPLWHGELSRAVFGDLAKALLAIYSPFYTMALAIPAGRTNAPMARKLILLVEDDALIAMEMEERLADMGYDVRSAATLEGAEAALQANRPDVALLDANLRGQSTVELGIRLAGEG